MQFLVKPSRFVLVPLIKEMLTNGINIKGNMLTQIHTLRQIMSSRSVRIKDLLLYNRWKCNNGSAGV